MTTVQQTNCDTCLERINSTNPNQRSDWSYQLTAPIVRYNPDKPIEEPKDFCSFKCLAIFVSKGEPTLHPMGGR